MLIGGHVSTAGGLVRALERAEERGCETMQIFNQSPRMWRPTRYGPDDFAAFRERLAASAVQSVYIHAVYLINVASDDEEVRRKSLESLVHALSVGDAIGADGVVVHPGSGRGQSPATAFRLVGTAMKKALAASERCPLLFENTAGAGFTIGRTFEELARVLEVSGGDGRTGVCLDSCHLLASGYEVRERDAFKAVVDEYERIVGIDRLRALHLNDSKVPLGGNADRHANLGEGELGMEGVRVFLSERRFAGLPVLIEVPGPDGRGPDQAQIELAKRLRDAAGSRRSAQTRSRRSNAR
jgi:deoxyribonuclease-4